MSWFVPYTSYFPVRTVTTTTASGWETVNNRCYGCKNSYVGYSRLMCSCFSRVIKHTTEGDVCESYRERGSA